MKRDRRVLAEDAMGRLVRKIEEPESALEAYQMLAASPGSVLEFLSKLKEWADRDLQTRGWPPEEKIIEFRADGTWSLAPEDGNPFKIGVKRGRGRFYTMDKAKPLTRDYFLARILIDIMWIESLGDNDPNRDAEIFYRAFSIGGHLRELQLRGSALGIATTGQKMRSTGRANAEAKLRRHGPTREARFKRMRELVPEIGVNKAAAQVSCEGLGTVSAIKKQWNMAVKKSEVPRLRKKRGTQP